MWGAHTLRPFESHNPMCVFANQDVRDHTTGRLGCPAHTIWDILNHTTMPIYRYLCLCIRESVRSHNGQDRDRAGVLDQTMSRLECGGHILCDLLNHTMPCVYLQIRYVGSHNGQDRESGSLNLGYFELHNAASIQICVFVRKEIC